MNQCGMTPISVSKPSATAIQSAILIRLRRSLIATVRNLPCRRGHEPLPEPVEALGSILRLLAVAEEAVERRPGAGDVRAERAELGDPLGEPRRREVVRRQRRKVAGLQLR